VLAHPLALLDDLLTESPGRILPLWVGRALGLLWPWPSTGPALPSVTDPAAAEAVAGSTTQHELPFHEEQQRAA